MKYEEALTYLDSLINYEKRENFDYKQSIKLERMRSLCRRLGDPHKGTPSIHITGTKGKGSVASFAHSILLHAGFKAGLYTSPHLFSFRERIRINGRPIDEESVSFLIDEIKLHVETMLREEGKRATYFELCTALAFLYFKREKVDFMVLEAGMGGRLDSTNVTDSTVSVITPVSYDHTRYLGTTLREIAREKSGIIKEGTVVISAPQKTEAMEVIREIASERKAHLLVIGKDIFFERIHSDLKEQKFRMLSRFTEYPSLAITLLGDFQIENAVCAISACEELRCMGTYIPASAVNEGARKAKWPGRLEILREEPFIIADGAQDAHSMRRLKEAVKDLFAYNRIYVIFGAMRDKDIAGMSGVLQGFADRLLITRSHSERAASPGDINKIVKKNSAVHSITVHGQFREALEKATAEAGRKDLILVTGSLYLVACAMESLKQAVSKERTL